MHIDREKGAAQYAAGMVTVVIAITSTLKAYGESQMGKILSVALAISVLLMNSAIAGGCAVNNLGQVICAPAGGGAATNNLGQVVTGTGGCARNNMGQVVCADESGGGTAVNNMGQVRTGRGDCVTNNMGQVMCSSQPGGGAAINNMGQAVCVGGCVPGR